MLQMGLLPLHMLDPPACGWIEEGNEAPTNEAFDRLMERASALGLCSTLRLRSWLYCFRCWHASISADAITGIAARAISQAAAITARLIAGGHHLTVTF